MYIYIDSNVIVSSEIKSESNYADSSEFMEFAEKIHSRFPDVMFVTSVFTFLELASAMIRRTQNEDKTLSLLYRVTTMWESWIKPVAPLAPGKRTSFKRLIDSLIGTAIKFHTPAADTIHAQTVYLYDFDYLVTWNKADFQGMVKEMKKLTIVTPSEMYARLRDLVRERTGRSLPHRVTVRVRHAIPHSANGVRA
jgi:hypothetical protein